VLPEQLDIGPGCHRKQGLGALDPFGEKRPYGRSELIIRSIGEGGMVEHCRRELAAVDEVVDAHAQRSRERGEGAWPKVRPPPWFDLGDGRPA